MATREVDAIGVLIVLQLGADDAAGEQLGRERRVDVATKHALLLAEADDAGEVAAKPSQNAAERFGKPRVRVERFHHQREDEAAVDCSWWRCGTHTRAISRERAGGIGRGTDRSDDTMLELGDAILNGFEEQLFLVAEVVVERALRDARGARDAIDRGALVAVARRSNRSRSPSAPSVRASADFGRVLSVRAAGEEDAIVRSDILNV